MMMTMTMRMMMVVNLDTILAVVLMTMMSNQKPFARRREPVFCACQRSLRIIIIIIIIIMIMMKNTVIIMMIVTIMMRQQH